MYTYVCVQQVVKSSHCFTVVAVKKPWAVVDTAG